MATWRIQRKRGQPRFNLKKRITTTAPVATITSSGLFALLYRNILTSVVTNHSFAVTQILVPVAYIFLQGYGFSSMFVAGLGYDSVPIGSDMQKDISYLAFATSGAMTFTIVEAARLSGAVIQRDKHNGMMRQILFMPFSKYDYVNAIILMSLMTAFLGMVILLCVGIPLLWNDADYTATGLVYMVASMVMGCIIFSSLSIMLSLLFKSSGENYELVSSAIFLFFIPATSPTFYSFVPELPEMMKYVFILNPMTYVLDVFRAGLFNQVNNATVNLEVIMMIVMSVALFLAAVKLLLSDRKNYE